MAKDQEVNKEDADLHDDKNSDEEEDTEEEDEDESSDEDESDDDQEEDDDEDSEDDDDDKPVTRKDLRKLQEDLAKDSSAKRRILGKDKNRTLKDKKNSQRPDPQLSETQKRVTDLEFAEQKRQFGHENKLSPVEVDYIFKLNNRPTKKFLKDPFIQGGLEAIRRAENARDNTPRGAGRNFSPVKGKTFAELKPDEKKQHFGSLQQSILQSKGRR